MAGKKPRSRKRVSQRQRVDELRRRVGVNFFIRGTRKGQVFSTREKIKLPRFGNLEFPVYHINPLFKMDAKEWIAHLQATTHAAVARAMEHGLVRFSFKEKEVRSSRLPVLMVFGPGYGGTRKALSGVKSVKATRAWLKKAKPRPEFEAEFRHQREAHEKGPVHGKIKPTFRESYLHGTYRTTIKGERFFFSDQKKLFQVQLTKKEAQQVIRRLNRQLKAKNLPSLAELHQKWWQADFKTKKKIEKQVQAFLQAKEWQYAAPHVETTVILTPAHALFHREAARILTNKLIRKSKQWVEKNLPKE